MKLIFKLFIIGGLILMIHTGAKIIYNPEYKKEFYQKYRACQKACEMKCVLKDNKKKN